MYAIIDRDEQIWGVLPTKEKATKFIEDNSSDRLRMIYVRDLEE